MIYPGPQAAFAHPIIRIFGFLLGFSFASAYASFRLLEEYKIASALLQGSVEELQASTEKVSLKRKGTII